LQIRVNGADSYYYTTYVDLLKTSTSQNSATYYIAVHKLSYLGRFTAMNEDAPAAAASYTKTVAVTDTRILTAENYSDYTVKKDGTGASGTWGISITGNAATATRLNISSTDNAIARFDGTNGTI